MSASHALHGINWNGYSVHVGTNECNLISWVVVLGEAKSGKIPGLDLVQIATSVPCGLENTKTVKIVTTVKNAAVNKLIDFVWKEEEENEGRILYMYVHVVMDMTH